MQFVEVRGFIFDIKSGKEKHEYREEGTMKERGKKREMSNTKSRYYDYDYDHNVRARYGATPQNGRATLLNVARLYFPRGGRFLPRGYLYLTRETAPPRETIRLTRKNVASGM